MRGGVEEREGVLPSPRVGEFMRGEVDEAEREGDGKTGEEDGGDEDEDGGEEDIEEGGEEGEGGERDGAGLGEREGI